MKRTYRFESWEYPDVETANSHMKQMQENEFVIVETYLMKTNGSVLIDYFWKEGEKNG